MFCTQAHSLIKEIDRNRDTILPYNNDLLKGIGSEVKLLICENQNDARYEDSRTESSISHFTSIKMRHFAIKRNLRCILAYHYHRLKVLRTMRWEFGSILPSDIKANLNPSEIQWFSKYSNALAQYMRTIGENGLDLSVDLKPPKTVYIEVKCLVEFGKFELNDGTVILLKNNSRHYLPRSECEELIRQGVFQHIV